jgi:hypothetical protein
LSEQLFGTTLMSFVGARHPEQHPSAHPELTVTPLGENGGVAVSEGAHDEVEGRVAELMGIVNSVTAELVAVIADVLDRELWAVSGIRSPEHWVAWQCGVSTRRARALVVMARRQAELPLTSALFAEGLLTEDAMAAVARRAPSDRDREVAELAPALLHSQLCRLLAAMPRPQPAEPPDPPEARDGLEFGVDGDRWRARADLPVELGLVVEQAWTAARSQVFHEQHPDEPDAAMLRSGVTWVDGLVRAAELALKQWTARPLAVGLATATKC